MATTRSGRVAGQSSETNLLKGPTHSPRVAGLRSACADGFPAVPELVAAHGARPVLVADLGGQGGPGRDGRPAPGAQPADRRPPDLGLRCGRANLEQVFCTSRAGSFAIEKDAIRAPEDLLPPECVRHFWRRPGDRRCTPVQHRPGNRLHFAIPGGILTVR
jgi:hypothetical protein